MARRAQHEGQRPMALRQQVQATRRAEVTVAGPAGRRQPADHCTEMARARSDCSTPTVPRAAWTA